MPTFVLTLKLIGTWRHDSFYVIKGSTFKININLRMQDILTELQESGTILYFVDCASRRNQDI